MRKVELKYCTVEHKGDHVLTTFPDGTSSANWPHPDDQSYIDVAKSCGFDDLMEYCWEHELLHSIMPEVLFDRPGYVVWMQAHQKPCNLAGAKAEERLIYYIQKWLIATLDEPFDPQWNDVVRRMNEVL